jgi:hypothetical protein
MKSERKLFGKKEKDEKDIVKNSDLIAKRKSLIEHTFYLGCRIC